MNILGIDFGEAKIGLAISEGELAEPLKVIANSKEQIANICQGYGIEKIVIGISEGRMAEKTRRFGEELAEMTGLPVEFQDETLTTQDVVAKMREIGKKIRREDALSAALILQGYLDRKEEKI